MPPLAWDGGREGRLVGRHLQILEAPRAAPASSLESKRNPREEVDTALPTAPTVTTTITLPVSHSGTASVCRAEIPCSHICACNSGEVREHCGTTRAARKEAWVFSHSPLRIKCILQFQWQMGEKHRHYCRGATGPAPTRGDGEESRGQPMAPGLSNPQDWEG